MTKKANRIFFIVSFCFCSSLIYSQNKVLDSMLRILNYSKEDTNKVKTLLELSIYQFQNREHKAALLYADSALILSKYLKWKTKEAQSYHLSANILWVTGKYADAIISFKNAIKVRETMEDTQAKIDAFYCYVGIGRIWLEQDKPSEAVTSFSSAFKLAEKHEIKGAMAVASSRLAHAYTNLNDHKQAIANYNLAIKIYEEMKDSLSVAVINNDIGVLQIEQGNYTTALSNFLFALNFFEKIKNKGQIASSLRFIGSVYNHLGNYAEALKNQMTALKLAQELKNNGLIAGIYFEMGNTYRDQENYSGALTSYFAALEINKTWVDSFWMAAIYHRIGTVYKNQAEKLSKQNMTLDSIKHKLFESKKIIEEAKKIFEKQNARDGIAETSVDLGIIIFKQAAFVDLNDRNHKYKEALDYLNSALALAKEIGLKKVMKEAYSGLAEINQKIGNYEEAYKYFGYYSIIKDSLFNVEAANKIGEIRITYETEKAQTAEKSRQEKVQTEMQFAFLKREDSLRFQQDITLASLDLINKQNDINRLAYINSKAELEVEQSRRKDKDQQLIIYEKEKALQDNQLALQKTELNLKENQIKAERRQRLFYIGGIVLLILLFLFIYRNVKNRQRTEKLVAAERLKSEKASAAHSMAELELQSLRAQLNPHFMFNSLNAIQELILKEDNENSHLYLSRFSELLRMLLDNANQPFVPLRKELNLLELYLSLEQLRVPDLKYTIEIDDDVDVNKMTIPNMMLQPYIENAIWHGLSHKKGEKNLFIRINKKGNVIICTVEDNGVGRKMSAELKSLYRKEHRSRGMELLSKRFTLISKEYGSNIQTAIEDLHVNGSASGTKVAITIPSSLSEAPPLGYSS